MNKIVIIIGFVIFSSFLIFIMISDYNSGKVTIEPDYVSIMPNRSNDVIITTSPGQTDPLDSYNSLRDNP